jgi:hypothetical protein
MEKTFTSRDGSYQHIEARRERDAVTFIGDRSGSECVHTLPADKFAEFIGAIGQPTGTDIMVAIGAVLESDPATVWHAIHDGFTETAFSWQSMDDIDDMMASFDAMRG